MACYLSKMSKWKESEMKSKNCAKNQNLNISTINQMSYIQRFFNQHLPVFFLETVRSKITHPEFLLHNNSDNIFDLTLDLILASQQCLSQTEGQSFNLLLAHHWRISYNDLRDVRLPLRQDDSEIVREMKSSLKYVYVQMLQILVRLVLCFQEERTAKVINETIRTNIQEIGYIYPALKIQISLSNPEINLTEWFQKYLTRITNFFPMNQTFRCILQEISNACNFFGALEKVFQSFTKANKVKSGTMRQVIIHQKKSVAQEPEFKILNNANLNSGSDYHQVKRIKSSSLSTEKRVEFDDFQLFRNKKKRIMKERFRGQRNDAVYKTPVKQREMSHSTTPITQKTDPLVMHSDTTEHNASSLLYRKVLKRKNIKHQQRTLYFGQTRRFVPKKSSGMDPESFIENMTASTLGYERPHIFEQILRKTERKVSRFEMQQEQSNMFYVPDTPKVQHYKKMQRSSSGQMGLGGMRPLKL